ncbi:MAG: aldo/keto reductase [Hyphomicrobiales bacterium]
MERITLGKSGLEVSRLCLGTMQFGWTAGRDASFAVLDAFAAAGGNFVDTADIYRARAKGSRAEASEEILGEWLEARANRDRFVVATKVRGRAWEGADGEGLSRAHIVRACEESLRRLHTDTIDLYQCHWYDDAVPIDETLRAFEELIAAGKVRFIGASNYPPERLTEALDLTRAHNLPGFVSLQPHYNLVHRREFERELQQLCAERGLAVLPYSPLAGGFLTGKYARGGERVRSARYARVSQYFTDEGWQVIDALREVAAAHGAPVPAVAIAWLLARPTVTAPILGANSPEQLAEQLPALSLALAPHEIQALDAASEPFRRYGPVHP